jgi:hypothetical protein
MKNLEKPPVTLPRLSTLLNFGLSALFGHGVFGIGTLKRDLAYLKQAADAFGVHVNFTDGEDGSQLSVIGPIKIHG